MPVKLLEGKIIADQIIIAVGSGVKALKAKYGRAPKLVAVQLGENASSAAYIKAQAKAAASAGIVYELKTLPGTCTQMKTQALIDELKNDDKVDAIILQLPVPKGIDANILVNTISADKDAEGMHPQNLGKVLLGNNKIGPCTATAVMEILASTGLDLYGKEAVVVGHSRIVGKPLSLMLLNKFATTTVCHIATAERGVLKDHVSRAEVLVVAVGKAGVVKGDWVKEGAIVVDVGINRVGDKLVGDVEFEGAATRASFITPVPGGVGPLTTAILMRNTLELFKTRMQG